MCIAHGDGLTALTDGPKKGTLKKRASVMPSSSPPLESTRSLLKKTKKLIQEVSKAETREKANHKQTEIFYKMALKAMIYQIGMDNVGEGSQLKRRRINWKKESVVRVFLEACIHEIVMHGREGTNLKPSSWKNVAETLKNKHNFIVEQKQMKNHYDYLKAKYNTWVRLKNKTGNVYDPTTNTFNFTRKNGNLKLRCKCVEPLRSTGLLFPDLCVQLFDGVQVTGIESHGPRSSVPNISDPLFYHLSGDVEVVPNTQQTPTPTSGQECDSRPKIQNKKRKSIQASNSQAEEDISKAVKAIMEKYSNDVPACLEKLDEIGWGTEHPLYHVATFIFSESVDYRKVWLCLKPESCEGWVRMIGRKYSMDVEEELLLLLLFYLISDNTSSLTEHVYTLELLNGSNMQCLKLMRLSRDAYILCNHFKQKNWLQNSRNASVKEKMQFFNNNRMIKRGFQHSTEIIHRYFRQVLRAMMEFAREVVQPMPNEETSHLSECQRNLRRIFLDAIGALDGTLIHAVIPVDQQARYRGRGIDKYYLCDAAYANTHGFMTPYRNTRYWLADFRR
ncbi:hypothetical protein OSB04_011192 [Centaurea solstitialis]|uniref:Myb/SANT-like domain-containing protein n=1 Tax=Centaurea solstitialis TaxID=347529 RepID=A0AA38TGI4_9ASTR|nr:hypothetical protein OSB04_011192 [Centaurea solstitialis]